MQEDLAFHYEFTWFGMLLGVGGYQRDFYKYFFYYVFGI
jgi:hypothetical protein